MEFIILIRGPLKISYLVEVISTPDTINDNQN